jgi:hypothetical protein
MMEQAMEIEKIFVDSGLDGKSEVHELHALVNVLYTLPLRWPREHVVLVVDIRPDYISASVCLEESGKLIFERERSSLDSARREAEALVAWARRSSGLA